MEENEMINEINEEAVNKVYEEVSNSNGNVLVKVLAGALVVAAGIGAVVLYKKKKRKYCELTTVEVIKEDVVENDDVSEE